MESRYAAFVLSYDTHPPSLPCVWRRVNNKGGPHNVVFDEEAIPSGVAQDSISMDGQLGEEGDSFSKSFSVAGTYEYVAVFCFMSVCALCVRAQGNWHVQIAPTHQR